MRRPNDWQTIRVNFFLNLLSALSSILRVILISHDYENDVQAEFRDNASHSHDWQAGLVWAVRDVVLVLFRPRS